MLKFFRKIRKNSVLKNKVSKYLLYALGEIVLVVIGILIALKINNVNENNKKAEIKENYYIQILEDLSRDYNYINSEIRRLKTNIALYNKYTSNFSKNSNLKELLYSQTKLNYNYMYLDFNTNTIETLQATGDIKLMPSAIRNSLIDLKNLQDNLIKTTSTNDDNFAETLISATKLGFSPKLLQALNNPKNKDTEPYKSLNVEKNYPQIGLIVNAAYILKNITENDQLRSSQNILNQIKNVFQLVNAKLKTPHESIENVKKGLIKLEKLLGEGKTLDEVITIVKNEDRANPVYNITENYINSLGYYYLTTLKEYKKALKIFKLNIEMYPNAWNTYDSYGECLLKMGDTLKAVKAYKKSLLLNSENENAKKIISTFGTQK